MDNMYTTEDTISDSKEESLAKAIRMLQAETSTDRPFTRPDISTPKIIIGFVLWVFVVTFLAFLCLHAGAVFHIKSYVIHPITTLVILIGIALKSKSMIQNTILLYQKYAPENMRRSCLFTPSCSEYMLLAIEKYGVIVGVCKGIRRLSRCHHPNGGVDYP